MSFPLFFWFDRNFASFPLIQHFPFACCHHSMLKHAYSFKSYYLTLLALSLPLTFTLKPVVYYDFFGLWSRSLMAMTLERFFFVLLRLATKFCVDAWTSLRMKRGVHWHLLDVEPREEVRLIKFCSSDTQSAICIYYMFS